MSNNNPSLEHQTMRKMIDVIIPDLKALDIYECLIKQGINQTTSWMIARFIISLLNSKGGYKKIVNDIVAEQNPEILKILINEIELAINEYEKKKKRD